MGASILNSLADNGGFTKTHILVIGSPAASAGSNLLCGVGTQVPMDQRDVLRDDGLCDIGAVEGSSDQGNVFVIPVKAGGVIIFGL